ncbi:High-affinity nicotinic acid transporter [Mycena chlorophos]|uniref:High-affinity nicotinic acid transporter n=1 Tax=Mycena chlorophos TaxID=658473 RepID=A0A8H6SZR4_MYCCL|nr:High-affinity nicotinic acid transporter [Mycena chlorophos]
MSDAKEDTKESAPASVDNSTSVAPQVYHAEVDTDGVDERKLVRKIDFTLIPWLSLLYLLSFLDRTSIGNAKLYNLEADLHMSDNQYLIALTVFFFSYAIFEVPSNVFLKRLRPSIWLSLLMLLWGVMMTVQGLVHNFGGLVGMRWMLGTFEAGLFPGVNYYLSCWYKRSEFGVNSFPPSIRSLSHRPADPCCYFLLRHVLLTTTPHMMTSWSSLPAATVSGAFGGLLAAAISNMDGIGGKPAWAWIFILEGLATVLAGALSFFIIQDFPDTAKFLTEAERVVVVRRLQSDDQFSAAGEKLRWKYIWKSLIDWKTWCGMMIYVGADMPLYAFSLFLPTIINQVLVYWLSMRKPYLLTHPYRIRRNPCEPPHRPGLRLGLHNNVRTSLNLNAILTAPHRCLVGFLADKHKNRGLFNLVFLCIGGAGYIILIASRNPALSYFATFVATCGIYPIIPNTIAWMSNNVEGSYKRSVSLAMVISFGNINGAVSSNVYRAKDKPWYRLGHGLVLMYIGFGIIASTIYLIGVRRENARRDRGERDEIIGGMPVSDMGHEKNGRFESVEEAKREKGDEWSGYRYTL